MHLAFITSDQRGAGDLLLERFAQSLMAKGVVVAGVVQTNTETTDNRHCDMDLRILPDGPVMRISQSLGEGARGCRLDTGALENAVSQSMQCLTSDTQLLILNKFGKREAEGRGFRELIGQAMLDGIPVLLAVKDGNRADFDVFSSGMADQISPDLTALHQWFDKLSAAKELAE